MKIRWSIFRLLIAVMIAATVVVSLVAGFTVSVKGFVFSAYGLVVIPRTLVQIAISIRNNFRNEAVSRRHLIAILQAHGYACPRFGRLMRFVEWRKALFAAHPGLEERWNTLVQQCMPTPRVVGVEIPVYGLTAEELRATVVSVLQQSVPLRIVVIAINQPGNPQLIDACYQMQQELRDSRLVVVQLPSPSKRGAMYEGFRLIHEAGCDITVNVDGDTVLDRDAIYTALMLIDGNMGIEGVTSNVNVTNRRTNLLTELTFQRYRYANEQERAAQSLFTGVTCMSGPLMVMLTRNVEQIADQWLCETFMGVPIGPGDDRSLTMHHLRRGRGVAYSPASVVWTDCPSQMGTWKRQQLRWSRSGMREFIRSFTWMHRMPAWSVFDQVYLMFFPLILGGIVISVIAEFARNCLTSGFTLAFHHASGYLLVLAAVNLFNGSVASIRNRDLRFLLSTGYILFHLRYLLWIKCYALFTLPESAWLTRGVETSAPSDQIREPASMNTR